MKNLILILFFSSFLSFAWSQSETKVITDTKVSEVTIQNSFDRLTLQSYAVQAQSKVEELLEYLSLAQNPANPTDLNEQLESNMTQLFIQGNKIQLTGIESKTNYATSINWIDDWKESNVKIISLELIDSELKSSYWIYNYKLNYEINGKRRNKKMKVQVYFKPMTKNFGSEKRAVWDLKIGDVIFL